MKRLLLAILIAAPILAAAYYMTVLFEPSRNPHVLNAVYRVGALFGNPKAQYLLGNSYYLGKGVETSYEESVKWYTKAAEQDYSRAQINLGYAYYFGHGVQQDYVLAFQWYRKAAEAGEVQAQLMLGDSYYRGQGMGKNDPEAVKWYRRAAEQGSPKGFEALGYAYKDGWGVDKPDIEEAIRWFKKAADSGRFKSLYNMAHIYSTGFGTIKQDKEQAAKYYARAVEAGRSQALSGDLDAQKLLGDMYFSGTGVKQDDAEAIKWWRMAAARGDTVSMGYVYYMVKKNKDMAKDEQGNPLPVPGVK